MRTQALETIPHNSIKLNGAVSRSQQDPSISCLLILFYFYFIFSTQRKLALRSCTDKRDFGKWLIWNLLEEFEIGEASAFRRKKKDGVWSLYVSVCACLCMCLCCACVRMSVCMCTWVHVSVYMHSSDSVYKKYLWASKGTLCLCLGLIQVIFLVHC